MFGLFLCESALITPCNYTACNVCAIIRDWPQMQSIQVSNSNTEGMMSKTPYSFNSDDYIKAEDKQELSLLVGFRNLTEEKQQEFLITVKQVAVNQ